MVEESTEVSVPPRINVTPGAVAYINGCIDMTLIKNCVNKCSFT